MSDLNQSEASTIIDKLIARIFTVKSNIVFGNSFIELNSDKIEKCDEIKMLLDEQKNYQKAIDKMIKDFESFKGSSKDRKKLENNADILLNHSDLLNSVLKVLNNWNEEDLYELPDTLDEDIKIEDVYKEFSLIHERANKNEIIRCNRATWCW